MVLKKKIMFILKFIILFIVLTVMAVNLIDLAARIKFLDKETESLLDRINIRIIALILRSDSNYFGWSNTIKLESSAEVCEKYRDFYSLVRSGVLRTAFGSLFHNDPASFIECKKLVDLLSEGYFTKRRISDILEVLESALNNYYDYLRDKEDRDEIQNKIGIRIELNQDTNYFDIEYREGD